jgi:hypothetical protein
MRRALVMIAALGFALPAAAQAGAVHLRISYGDGDGHHRRATLDCDSDGFRASGFLRHRDADRLCRRAYKLEHFLAGKPDPGRACAEIYGGPDRARIRGNVRGSSVDRRFGRADGCEIADWDRARLLLPRPAGTAD